MHTMLTKKQMVLVKKKLDTARYALQDLHLAENIPTLITDWAYRMQYQLLSQCSEVSGCSVECLNDEE